MSIGNASRSLGVRSIYTQTAIGYMFRPRKCILANSVGFELVQFVVREKYTKHLVEELGCPPVVGVRVLRGIPEGEHPPTGCGWL